MFSGPNINTKDALYMYLKACKRILQNKLFWRAPEPRFCVHRDRGFWLELWKAVLTKYELTTQNINFFNLKPLSRESTDRKEYFLYIKRVYIFSRKNFRAIWNFRKNTFFFVFFCFLLNFSIWLGFPIGFEKFHFRHDFFQNFFSDVYGIMVLFNVYYQAQRVLQTYRIPS